MSKVNRMFLIIVSIAALLGASTAAFAVITYTNIGTAAPPASLGPYLMTPFNVVSQSAISDSTVVTTIPGSPLPGDLTVSENVTKWTVPDTWSVWSHGYTGPVFGTTDSSITMTLPPGSKAFYFYAEPDDQDIYTITATTDSGTTSGPIDVDGNGGATGFGFYAGPGESISTITVTTTDSDFAIGEFGISASAVAAPVPTMNDWGIIVFMIFAGIVSTYYLRRRKTDRA